MVKYKQYVQQMMTEHQAKFDAFKVVHDGYLADRKQWSQRFHAEGQELLDIIRDWDRRLCAGMERGKFANYSNKLSEKFWAEVKKYLSHIDLVGVKSSLD
jgi:hypothetical protein